MPERVIVNFGVYQFTNEQRAQRRLRLTSQVERMPDNQSLNFRLQKPRSFYGWAQVMSGPWVIETIELLYEYQLLIDWENTVNQQQIFHYCTQLNTAQNAAQILAAVSGGAEILPGQTINIERAPFDRVVFKLFSNTTLIIADTTEPFINPCGAPTEIDTLTPPLSEPSPLDVPENPLDSPYDVPDPPYDLPSADDGETYNPQVPEEPIGDGDGNFTVTTNAQYIANLDTGATSEFPQSYVVPGPIFNDGKKTRQSESDGITVLEIWIEIRYGASLIAESSKQTVVGTLSEADIAELIAGYVILEVSAVPV